MFLYIFFLSTLVFTGKDDFICTIIKEWSVRVSVIHALNGRVGPTNPYILGISVVRGTFKVYLHCYIVVKTRTGDISRLERQVVMNSMKYCGNGLLE